KRGSLGRRWTEVTACVALRAPVLELDALKVCVVARVQGNEAQGVDLRDSDDLTVGKGRGLSGCGKTCTLGRVPGGGALVVGHNRHRERDDLCQVSFDCDALGRPGQAIAAKPQFVPDNAGNGQFILMTLETRE